MTVNEYTKNMVIPIPNKFNLKLWRYYELYEQNYGYL